MRQLYMYVANESTRSCAFTLPMLKTLSARKYVRVAKYKRSRRLLYPCAPIVTESRLLLCHLCKHGGSNDAPYSFGPLGKNCAEMKTCSFFYPQETFPLVPSTDSRHIRNRFEHQFSQVFSSVV